MDSRLVLPQPLGPTMLTNSPSSTRNDMLSMTRVSPSGVWYVSETRRTATAAVTVSPPRPAGGRLEPAPGAAQCSADSAALSSTRTANSLVITASKGTGPSSSPAAIITRCSMSNPRDEISGVGVHASMER